MFGLIVFVVLLVSTYFIGTKVIEKKHYTSIIKREKQFLSMPTVTADSVIDHNRPIKNTRMVYGNVVVSIDYFKRFLAGLRNIFGGEVSSYETVIDRARREAILRLKESAGDADIIVNLRLETVIVGNSSKRNQVGCSEILAYGTAITFAKDPVTNG